MGDGSILWRCPGTGLSLPAATIPPAWASLCFLYPGALARAADLHVGAVPGALLHGPAGMAPQGMLCLGHLTNHGASVSATTGVREGGVCPTGLESSLTLCLLLSRPQQMNQFPVGGQSASSLQDPPQLYSPTSQPQFPLPRGIQQVPGAWRGPGLRGRHSSLGLARDCSEPQFTYLEHENNMLHHIMGLFIRLP